MLTMDCKRKLVRAYPLHSVSAGRGLLSSFNNFKAPPCSILGVRTRPISNEVIERPHLSLRAAAIDRAVT